MKNLYKEYLQFLRNEAEEYYCEDEQNRKHWHEEEHGLGEFFSSDLANNINMLLWRALDRGCEYADLEAIANDYGVCLSFE